jgi:hypothetical protein
MGWIQCVDRRPQATDVWITCSRCGGGGSERGRESEPTDRAHLHGETPGMAWQGYRPTNVCTQCGGEGGTWLPKSKNKSRLNVAYATVEDRDKEQNWISGSLQTWYPDKGCWHPPVSQSISADRVWKFESDTDPDQWEGDK